MSATSSRQCPTCQIGRLTPHCQPDAYGAMFVENRCPAGWWLCNSAKGGKCGSYGTIDTVTGQPLRWVSEHTGHTGGHTGAA